MSDRKKTGPKSDIMTVREVAGYLNCHYSTIYRLLGNGAIPAFRLGDWRFRRADIEQWIKEGKQAAAMTRLSCHRFRANEVRLWLSLIAYNLGNLWRRLALPSPVATWSLTSLQPAADWIKHARYYWSLLAENHLTRRLFAGMLAKTAMLPSPAG